jgi:hypothetical protein
VGDSEGLEPPPLKSNPTRASNLSKKNGDTFGRENHLSCRPPGHRPILAANGGTKFTVLAWEHMEYRDELGDDYSY